MNPRTWDMDFVETVVSRPAGVLAVMQELMDEAPERFLARLMIQAGELYGPETPAGLGHDAWEASYRTLLDLTPEGAWKLLNVIRRNPAEFVAALAFWSRAPLPSR